MAMAGMVTEMVAGTAMAMGKETGTETVAGTGRVMVTPSIYL